MLYRTTDGIIASFSRWSHAAGKISVPGDLCYDGSRQEHREKPAEVTVLDITYITGQEKFNYRVCVVIIRDGRILAMHDERSPYYYLPGGRVQMGETAEHAVVREVEEELEVTPEIIRPLWLNQSFFTEDVDHLRYHEICIYYLTGISGTGLEEKGEAFTLYEGRHTHRFEWLPFERLKDEYFYPGFLKTAVYELPEHFTIRSEYE